MKNQQRDNMLDTFSLQNEEKLTSKMMGGAFPIIFTLDAHNCASNENSMEWNEIKWIGISFDSPEMHASGVYNVFTTEWMFMHANQ